MHLLSYGLRNVVILEDAGASPILQMQREFHVSSSPCDEHTSYSVFHQRMTLRVTYISLRRDGGMTEKIDFF